MDRDESAPSSGELSRRRLCVGIGAVATTALAGCPTDDGSGNESDPDASDPGGIESGGTGTHDADPGTRTESEDGTGQGSETEFSNFRKRNFEYVQTVESEAGTATLIGQISDGDGLQEVRVTLDNSFLSEEREITTEQVDAERYSLETSFPTTWIAPGENTIHVEATDTRGNTETTTITHEVYRHGFQLDIVNENGESIGNYSSDRQWDNYQFNGQHFMEETRQQWVEQVAYTGQKRDPGLLQQLENNADIESSLYAYPNGEGYDYGHWDLQSFQEATDMEEIISWIQPAIGEWVNRHEQGAPSIRNNNYSATAEMGINQLHPEKNNILSGCVNTKTEQDSDINNHGVSILYDGDEQDYWLMDTVSNQVMNLQEALDTEGNIDKFSERGQYNPIIDGYDEQALQEYDIFDNVMRSSAFAMVETFVNPGSGESYDFESTWMDDEYLESTIEGMQNGEPLEELVEQQMHASAYHTENYDTEREEGVEVGVAGSWNEAEVFKGSSAF